MLPLILIALGIGVFAFAKKKPAAPAPVKAAAPPFPKPIVPPSLDKGMPVPLGHAVAVALVKETNIGNLQKFAAAMKDYPIARGLIVARGRILEAQEEAKKKYSRPSQDAAIQAAINAPTEDEARAFLQVNNVPKTTAVWDKVQSGRTAKGAKDKLFAQAVHDAARATGNITTAMVLAKYPAVPRNAALLDAINKEKARLDVAAKTPKSYDDFLDNPFVTFDGLWLFQGFSKPLPPIDLVKRLSGSPYASYLPGGTPSNFIVLYPAGQGPAWLSTVTKFAKANPGGPNLNTGGRMVIKSQAGGAIQLQDGVEWHKSAGVLKAQSDAIIAKIQQDVVTAQANTKKAMDAYNERMRREAAERAKHHGLFGSIGDALGSAVDGLGDAVDSAMREADKVPGLNVITAPYRAAQIGTKFLSDVAEGKNVAESIGTAIKSTTAEMKKAVGTIKTLAPVLSYVPGIGSGVAVALTTAAGVAMGEPIKDAALDGVAAALPGAPVSQMAFKAAVNATEAIAEGKPLSDVALGAARDGFLAAAQQAGLPKEAAGAAFDSGVALGKGKNLQDAGFAAMHDLAQGNDLVEKATSFTQALTTAKQKGMGVRDVLVDQAVSNVQKLGSDAAETQLRPLLSQMSSAPDLMNMNAADLAKKAGVPQEIAHAALAATKPVTDKIRVLDANIVNRLLPNAPVVSPAAQALLSDPTRLQQVTQLAKQGSTNAQIVQTAAEVARMAQEKSKWQQYYEQLERMAA